MVEWGVKCLVPEVPSGCTGWRDTALHGAYRRHRAPPCFECISGSLRITEATRCGKARHGVAQQGMTQVSDWTLTFSLQNSSAARNSVGFACAAVALLKWSFGMESILGIDGLSYHQVEQLYLRLSHRFGRKDCCHVRPFSPSKEV